MKTPETSTLRKLSASCRRMVIAIQSDKPRAKLKAEGESLVNDMAAVLEELGLWANAQLLLDARHKLEDEDEVPGEDAAPAEAP